MLHRSGQLAVGPGNGSPVKLEPDRVKCADEAHFGAVAFDGQRRLGDLQSDQVVSNQGAPDFLIHAFHGFRAQDQGRSRSSGTDATTQHSLRRAPIRYRTHLPVNRPSPKGGRARIDDLATLTGIPSVARTGISEEYSPHEVGSGSGMSRWLRLSEWTQADVRKRTHEAILRRRHEYDHIESDRASID
jgi:hypothetical protein